MSLIVFALLVFLVVVMLIWAIDQTPNGPPMLWVAKIIIILVGVLLILEKARML